MHPLTRSVSPLLPVSVVVTVLGMAAASGSADEPGQAKPAQGRVFGSSRLSMDEMLTRPYDPDVPMGCVGDRVWASSPQGWAFRDDVHWLYLTNLKAFDIEIRDEHGLLQPAKATYFPSHVHLDGATRAVVASASFTFTIDNAQNPLSKPYRPEKRWTCWSSGKREDWYAVDFGAKRRFSGLKVFFFDDAPGGGCRPPERFELQRWTGTDWDAIPVTNQTPEKPTKGENTVAFDVIGTDRIRLVFRNAGENFYTGLYGFEPIPARNPADAGKDSILGTTDSPATSLEISGAKFITADDMLVSVIRIHNPTQEPQTVRLIPVVDWSWTDREMFHSTAGWSRTLALRIERRTRLHDFDVSQRLRVVVVNDPPEDVPRIQWTAMKGGRGSSPVPEFLRTVGFRSGYEIAPGKTTVFKAAMELKLPEEQSALDRMLRVAAPSDATDKLRDVKNSLPAAEQDSRDPLAVQLREYQTWFDDNLAYFDCSDPWVRKMYYHRAYNLRKNSMDPKLGRMQWKAQSEGRWRSGWYPNVISYGGGHQVREARWLRDASYSQGQVRTFADNEKADGVYPSHVIPNGPASGQYTDWITSSAWDAHLVHPDRDFLAAVADKLAANVRGWQQVYDPDGDGLLLVDSHWWTGMEYQPSFFFFSNYKPAKNFGEPEHQVSLDRVDLTAYNFGNAVAVARIYREIGQPDKAREFDDLAAKIAGAVCTKMWDPKDKFFYSLKRDDGAKADVKEVIGVYPFYFGMLPVGSSEHYEAAWQSILDPDQFWTPWPVASASKKCPAYSQTNWPGDGRAAGCMWNGPTWPHANSLVMTAMARTIRAGRESRVEGQEPEQQGGTNSSATTHHSPLATHHLWDLFISFTKAQYRDQDLTYPWTGEYYNGETAKWKTAERDYNHSTWLDVLIPDLIGLVPRSDDLLEIDPLLPPGKLTHFLLDGQHYHGHNVTVLWDDPQTGEADHYGDDRKGLDVYLDGKLVASAQRLTRIVVSLKR